MIANLMLIPKMISDLPGKEILVRSSQITNLIGFYVRNEAFQLPLKKLRMAIRYTKKSVLVGGKLIYRPPLRSRPIRASGGRSIVLPPGKYMFFLIFMPYYNF